MNSIKVTAILVGAMPVLAAAAAIGANVFAQEPKAPAKDYNQRALEIYEFRRAAASGPERGQEIFYYISATSNARSDQLMRPGLCQFRCPRQERVRGRQRQ
jgi:hypothetical protein